MAAGNYRFNDIKNKMKWHDRFLLFHSRPPGDIRELEYFKRNQKNDKYRKASMLYPFQGSKSTISSTIYTESDFRAKYQKTTYKVTYSSSDLLLMNDSVMVEIKPDRMKWSSESCVFMATLQKKTGESLDIVLKLRLKELLDPGQIIKFSEEYGLNKISIYKKAKEYLFSFDQPGIKLNSIFTLKCEDTMNPFTLWGEIELPGFDYLRSKDGDQKRNIVTANHQVLIDFQKYIYDTSNGFHTIVDLQGMCINGCFILGDLEFTDTLFPSKFDAWELIQIFESYHSVTQLGFTDVYLNGKGENKSVLLFYPTKVIKLNLPKCLPVYLEYCLSIQNVKGLFKIASEYIFEAKGSKIVERAMMDGKEKVYDKITSSFYRKHNIYYQVKQGIGSPFVNSLLCSTGDYQ